VSHDRQRSSAIVISVPALPLREPRRLSDEALAACPELPACREILVHRYEDKIRACARRMSLDAAEADDLAQETFVRVLEALPRFGGRARFDTWLTRIAKNTCTDHFRRGKTRRTHRFDPADVERFWAEQRSPVEGPFGQVIRDSLACHLDQAIAELGDEQRAVAQLALVEDLSQAEIAERLGISTDAVKGRLKRARAALRSRLADPSPCPRCAQLGGFSVRADGTLE
jgi:RNA polymerase sigma-70 factor, ECF subfamily